MALDTSTLSVGDFVNVYQKPFTNEDFEDVGKIVRIVSFDCHDGVFNVEVVFKNDPHTRYRRIITNPQIVQSW